MNQKMKMELNKFKDIIANFYQQRKVLVWIGAGILAAATTAAIIFLPMSPPSNAAGDMQFVEVIRGSLTESLGEVGYVEAEPSASLIWKSSGVVGEFDLTVGDKVKKDDVLMELVLSSWPNASLEAQSDLLAAELALENMSTSDSEFQTALQAVIDAELLVEDTRSMVNFWNFNQQTEERVMEIRESYLEAEQLAWAAAKSYEQLRQTSEAGDPDMIAAYEAMQEADLERDKLLRAFNYILGHSYDQDVEADFIEYEIAKDNFEVARVAYERLLDESEEISASQAEAQSLQNTVNEARIIAPFDGTITDISYMPGEYVKSGTVAVQIDDLNNMMVNIMVSEIDIAEVALGQPVIVTFTALSFKEYSGIVTEIASAGADSSGSVTFAVSVAVDNADGEIKPGFTAEVNIITSQAEDALLVPTQALLGQTGNYRLMVIGGDGVPSPVPVEIGASSEEYTEITSGNITVGDRLVVTASQGALSNEQRDMMRMIRELNGGGGPPDGGGGGNRPNN